MSRSPNRMSWPDRLKLESKAMREGDREAIRALLDELDRAWREADLLRECLDESPVSAATHRLLSALGREKKGGAS